MAGNIYGVVLQKDATSSTIVSRGYHVASGNVTWFDQRKSADNYMMKVAQDNPGYYVYAVRGYAMAKSQSTPAVKIEITDKDEILPQD